MSRLKEAVGASTVSQDRGRKNFLAYSEDSDITGLAAALTSPAQNTHKVEGSDLAWRNAFLRGTSSECLGSSWLHVFWDVSFEKVPLIRLGTCISIVAVR